MTDFIYLDGKKYKVVDNDQDSWQPARDRQRTYEVGLTGRSIIQDFTRPDGAGGERMPRDFHLILRVFISTPWPDSSFGVWSDLLAAYNKPTMTYVEHDGVTTHTVGMQGQLLPVPRVGANIDGVCFGIFFVEVNLVKIY